MVGEFVGRRKLGGSLIVLLVCYSVTQAQKPRRAKPPIWKNQGQGVFFQDAFQDGLRGERPATLGQSGVQPPTSPADAPGAVDPAPAEFAWSALISATVVEDEIKQINIRCGDAIQSEGFFKSQGYLDVRPQLGVAAVLFAVVDRYDQPIRWQESAAVARDALARGALNAKVGSSQVFREVTQLRQGLSDLIRGSRWPSDREPQPLNWETVADRQLLMQRLESSDQDVLSAGVASASDFSKEQDRLRREAELVTLIGYVLRQDGMPEAGDPEYDGLCDDLSAAAKELVKAIEQQDQKAAQRAHGEVKRSCTRCHGIYRV